MSKEQYAASQKVKTAAYMGANLLREIDSTSYVVVAVTTMRDADGEPTYRLSALYTNLFWEDPKDGRIHPPTIGQMTDLIVEARLSTPTAEINQTVMTEENLPRA